MNDACKIAHLLTGEFIIGGRPRRVASSDVRSIEPKFAPGRPLAGERGTANR